MHVSAKLPAAGSIVPDSVIDSITMLEIALKAWSLGFHVDAEGALHKLPSG
jgi:hypothetical protein